MLGTQATAAAWTSAAVEPIRPSRSRGGVRLRGGEAATGRLVEGDSTRESGRVWKRQMLRSLLDGPIMIRRQEKNRRRGRMRFLSLAQVSLWGDDSCRTPLPLPFLLGINTSW